jgi:hypothetical protein
MYAPTRTSPLRWPACLLALLFCLLLVARTAVADGRQPDWVEHGTDGQTQVHLYFFWSENCPHCLAAHPFIEAIPQQRPWVVLHALEVSRNEENARHFVNMVESLGQRAEAVPTLIACGWLEVGWQDEASSGARLLAALDACR